MKDCSFMIIAGEPSGDQLGAELIHALRKRLHPDPAIPESQHTAAPRLTFFGAGGRRLAEAGVEVLEDLTVRSVIGISDVAAGYFALRRAFHKLVAAAETRRPDIILLIDYSHFNHKFARAIRKLQHTRSGDGDRKAWSPLIIKYVSPQVWASRPGRAQRMPHDIDLLLAIFPFEVEWYRHRVPQLRVKYVGHPVLDRHPEPVAALRSSDAQPLILLLPGSRTAELQRHIPILVGAVAQLRHRVQGRFVMVLPGNKLLSLAKHLIPEDSGIELVSSGLAEWMGKASLAIASTGSVTMECARFLLPTIAIYRTSFLTYTIGRWVVNIPYLAMPNILAGEVIFPEFIQHDATPGAIAKEAASILESPSRTLDIRQKLATVIAGLGTPGASDRAADEVIRLIENRSPAR